MSSNNNATTTTTTTTTTSGRVIKLHFACMAPLPHGSSLRVSSSSLWAPAEASSGVDTSDDDYHYFASALVSSGVGSVEEEGSRLNKLGLSKGSSGGGDNTNTRDSYRLYASSVEMFTTPEMYPLWRTRTPVVITASGASSSSSGTTNNKNLNEENEDVEVLSEEEELEELIKEHRYRYMVVTPGAVLSNESQFALEEEEGGEKDLTNHMMNTSSNTTTTPEEEEEEDVTSLAVRTRLSIGTSFGEKDLPVMMWEDPFLMEQQQQQHQSEQLTSTSIASVTHLNNLNDSKHHHHHHPTNVNLADLPYRTRFINVSKTSLADGTFGSSSSSSSYSYSLAFEKGGGGGGNEEEDDMEEEEEKEEEGEVGKENYTEDGVRIDYWNDALDYTFKPFLHEKNLKDTEQTTRESQAYDSQIRPHDNENETNNNNDAMNVDNNQDDHHHHKRQKQHHPERVFLVCYHLPVLLTRTPSNPDGWTACWSESLIAKTEQSGVTKTHDTYWIGTVSSVVPPIQTQAEKDAVRKILEPMNCIPLFLHDEIEDAHYLGMCKQVLWPAFHNIDLLEMASSGWGQQEKYGGGGGGSGANFYYNTHDNSNTTTTTTPSSPPSSPKQQQQPQQPHAKQVNTASPTTVTKPTQSDWDQSRLDVWWSAYTAVNKIFADTISAMMRPHDTIWVHDYHLSLLPKLLDTAARQQYLDATAASVTSSSGDSSAVHRHHHHHHHRRDYHRTIKMVYFLHIPFPTSQVFRELEHGEAILEGMLNADIVGFHAFDHARHFLNASKRILGLTYETLVGGLIGVRYKGRKVIVSMSNVSIEPDIVDAALTLPSVAQEAAFLKEKHGERSIIAGVDVCQKLSGISLKLLSFERLLTDYPNWQPKVVMLLKCMIPGSRRTDEADTLREVRFLVRRIQDNFGTSVIDYQELMGSSLPIDQRLAIWKASDIMMMTPIRQGLNLLPLEYVFAKKAPDYPGVTIASEFSAVCTVLNGALRINPFDVQNTSTSIEKALSMEIGEREARRARDINFVASCPSGLWTKNVLRDLADATLGTYADGGAGEDDEIIQKKRAAEKLEAVDSPEAILAREGELALSKLDVDKITTAYLSCKSRVIICDFNGTLVVKEPPGKYLKREILGTAGNKPPEAVIKALTTLCADPKNTVFVVSGDSQKNLEDAVGNIPGLGLAASNGACFASPVTNIQNEKRIWKSFDLGVDWNAVREVALPVLSKYTARTNGSFVKLTHSSIGWSYYSCDPEWGSLQASYLVPELEYELRAFDVRFVTLKGIVEVVPRKLNKGLIVTTVLREAAAKNNSSGVDFVLCMGDDVSDEKMFTSVFSYIAETGNVKGSFEDSRLSDSIMEDASSTKGNSSEDGMYAYNVAVGRKPSHASFYVDSADDVGNVLISLSGGEVPIMQNMSWDSEASGNFFA